MGFIHGRGSKVLFGAYDLSTFFNNAGTNSAVDANDSTTFGVVGGSKTFIVGLRDGKVSISGLFDGAVAAVDERIQASLGSDTEAPMTVALDGFAIGRRVQIAQAKTTSYDIKAPVADVVSVSADFQADGGVDGGVSLSANLSVSATTDEASVDNAASSAFGGRGQLHVLANTRNVNSVVKIQHSADNSTWVDLITFATIATTVITSARSLAAGTVNRYLRAQITLSAGTGAIQYQVSFARLNS